MTKKMMFDPTNSQMLPEGTTHLHGTFFKVPFASIQIPEEKEGGKEYHFINPRLLTEFGEKELLFGKKSASELRESIKKCTLLNPLVCRWQQAGDTFVPVLVGGDRRYRALDWLIKNNVDVADPRSYDIKNTGEVAKAFCPARDAYQNIVCQIFAVNNDLEALAISWAENKNRINLTDGHEVAEVIKLRKYAASDDVILEILQRDERWLAETDRLISKLDEETLHNLLESRIDRSAALSLLEIDNQEIRREILNKANDLAEKKNEKKKEQVKKILKNALDKKEEAEGIIADYEVFDEEDDEVLEEAKKVVEDSSKKVRKSIKKRDELKPVTKAREINKAKMELSDKLDPADKIIRCLSPKKIKTGIDYLCELIRDDGVCPRGSFKANVESLQLVVKILEDNILNNEDDFALTLENFFENTVNHSLAVIEDEIPEGVQADPEDENFEHSQDDLDDSEDDFDDEDKGFTGEIDFFGN